MHPTITTLLSRAKDDPNFKIEWRVVWERESDGVIEYGMPHHSLKTACQVMKSFKSIHKARLQYRTVVVSNWENEPTSRTSCKLNGGYNTLTEVQCLNP